jgi:hypothetical protein
MYGTFARILTTNSSMSVNLGPVAPTLAEPEVVSTGAGSAYNPRCLKRDVSVWVSSQWNTDQNSSDLITQYTDIASFQTRMQGDFATGFYGVHTGGHFTIGLVNINIPLLYHHPNTIQRRPRRRHLYFPRRPGFLPPPRTDRPHLVDLAKPRPQEQTKCHCRNHHARQLSA